MTLLAEEAIDRDGKTVLLPAMEFGSAEQAYMVFRTTDLVAGGGQSHLGKILMRVRGCLRQQDAPKP